MTNRGDRPLRAASARWTGALLVLVLHLALFAWLSLRPAARSIEPKAEAATPRLVVRLVPLVEPAPAMQPAASPRSAGQAARRTLSAPHAATAARAEVPASLESPPTASPPEPPQAAASAGEPSVLDPAVLRRAARESALGHGATPAHGAVESGVALRGPTASQRWSGQMQQAGRGDCAKGEYAGGGAGLLSLPFLAAAAAKGECAK